MIILMAHTKDQKTVEAARQFDTTGHRSYMLNTSRGDIFTIFDLKESDYDHLKRSSNNYTFFKPSVPYILASKFIKDTKTIITLNNNISIGGSELSVMAGPCSIESEEQIMKTAEQVKRAGAHILRGGAYKPRTSPYSFQGMGVEGLQLLKKAGDAYGLAIVTEVLDTEDIPVVSEFSDILQVGARNCQNFSLLKKLGKIKKPVLLKRGMMNTVDELLMSAEYILSEGNMNVILCERGIRTFETGTRNTLDISAIPLLKEKTHLPVIVDPSHATGSWKLIEPMSMAAVAAGTDGLLIEVHNEPDKALCDGIQSLKPENFSNLMYKINLISDILHRVKN